MPPVTAKEIMFEAHEDRLQTLEQGHLEVSKQVAVLVEQVETGFKNIENKIDSVIAPIMQKLSWHIDEDTKSNEQITSVVDQISKHEEILSDYQEKQVKSTARRLSLLRGVWGLVLVLAGAAVKEVFVLVFKIHGG